MAGGDGGARGGGPVSRELRAGLRRERHRGGLSRGARGAGSVTDLLSLTPDAARAALAQWLAARDRLLGGSDGPARPAPGAAGRRVPAGAAHLRRRPTVQRRDGEIPLEARRR